MSVILLACPVKVRTTLLVSVSMTWRVKLSHATASMELRERGVRGGMRGGRGGREGGERVYREEEKGERRRRD